MQRREVMALVVAPVSQPVLRLRLGVAQPFEAQSARHVHLDRLAQIACLQALQVRNRILNFNFGKKLTVVSRHQRRKLAMFLDQVALIDPVHLSRLVSQDQVVAIFGSCDSTKLLAVPGLYAHHAGPKPAPPAERRAVRVQDHAAQVRRGIGSGGRQIGPHIGAAAIYLVAAATAALAPERLLACGYITSHHFIGGRAVGVEAAKIGDDSPDGVGRQSGKGGHLRAGNAIPDGLEQVVVFAAMPEVSPGQRWTTVSSRLAAMAGLTGLPIQLLPGSNGSGIAGKGILYHVGRVRSLCDHLRNDQAC